MYEHEKYGWKRGERGEYTRPIEDFDSGWSIASLAVITAIMMKAYKEGTNGRDEAPQGDDPVS